MKKSEAKQVATIFPLWILYLPLAVFSKGLSNSVVFSTIFWPQRLEYGP